MSAAPGAPAGDPARGGTNAYRHWLGTVASWFGFWGAQSVMFQWLVVDQLHEGPERVGNAQMMLSLPLLLFLLVGGAAADRFDPRRVLLGLQLGAAAIVAALAWVLVAGSLGYGTLILYAFAVGTLQAFGLPARDTQLSNVVQGDLSRAVAGATIIQHGSQVLGSLLAGSAGWLGGPLVLGLQFLTLLAGLPAIARLPAATAPRSARPPIRGAELRAGLSEVLSSPVLRPVLLFACTAGVFFVGPYMVVLPLMVRDVYGGGATEMGILTAMFPLGSLIGGLAIVGRGGLPAKGRALLIGHLSAAFFIAAIALALPFAGTAALTLGWGLCGALFLNAGRTLFQEHASEAQRARVLSVYTLGVLGGSTFGTQLTGRLSAAIGLQATLLVCAGSAFVLAIAIVGTSRLLSFR